jgi:tetrahydromethanopterin S-methyltransferase subunit C
MPAKVIASTMGLGAFAVAIIAGLAVDNPADHILSRAIVSMFLCNIVGLVVGTLAERAVVDSIDAYIRARPVREQLTDASDLSAHAAPSEQRRAAA